MAQLQLPHSEGWDTLTRSHISVLKMFFFYALPLSAVPPAMIYYAGVTYGGNLLPALSEVQLQIIGTVFFCTELAMTFLMAYVIQRMGDVIDIKPAYEDAYKLAVVAPTPLWLSPLFLFIPSFTVNLTVASLALILSGMLIFYSVPSILKVEEKGHAFLLSGSILSAGTVAWAAMMYLTLIAWSAISSNPML
ncbi:MAG TPA: Yip1 family protein [Sideroxyarcus sp.]|nr:Yip1 family protein [Sideroxyarcus sp.]